MLSILCPWLCPVSRDTRKQLLGHLGTSWQHQPFPPPMAPFWKAYVCLPSVPCARLWAWGTISDGTVLGTACPALTPSLCGLNWMNTHLTWTQPFICARSEHSHPHWAAFWGPTAPVNFSSTEQGTRHWFHSKLQFVVSFPHTPPGCLIGVSMGSEGVFAFNCRGQASPGSHPGLFSSVFLAASGTDPMVSIPPQLGSWSWILEGPQQPWVCVQDSLSHMPGTTPPWRWTQLLEPSHLRTLGASAGPTLCSSGEAPWGCAGHDPPAPCLPEHTDHQPLGLVPGSGASAGAHVGFMPPHCVAGQGVLSSGCCLHPTGLQDLPTVQANAQAALAARPDSPSQARACPVS